MSCHQDIPEAPGDGFIVPPSNETLEREVLQYHKQQLAYIDRLHDFADSHINVIQVLSQAYTPKPHPTAPATPAWLVAIEEKANKQVAEALEIL